MRLLLALCVACTLAVDSCPKTDLLLLIDGSSSLGEKNFLKEVGFAKEVMIQMGLSPKGNRAVLVQYTDEVTREHEGVLTDIGTAVTVCKDIHYHRGASFLDTALEYARAAFKELDRPVNRVVLIISDGESQTDPRAMAADLHKDGVSIISVLTTESLLEDDEEMLTNAVNQMRNISRGNLATVDTFKDLNTDLAKRTAELICDMGRLPVHPPPNIPPPPPPAGDLPGPLPVDSQNCIVEYGKFTTCSKTCGSGEKHQFGRVLQPQLGNGKPCSSLVRAVPCNTHPCGTTEGNDRVGETEPETTLQPIDCAVEYKAYECSRSCGGGVRVKEGTIVAKPANGGRTCPPLTIEELCNDFPCAEPVDCQVTYSHWSICTKSCGDGGFRVRAIHVVKPAANGGEPCPAERFLQEPCNMGDCPTAVDFDCSSVDEGDHPLSLAECSKQYVTCAVGTPFLRNCAAGLYFSPADKVCDTWVYACGHRTRPPTTTTEMPPMELITEEPPLDCQYLTEGDYPHPDQQCSSYYYSCAHGQAHRRDCPHGLYYSNLTKRCDEYAYVYECSGRRPVPTTPVPTRSFQLTKEEYPIDCSIRKNGEYEHPTRRCSRIYYTCDNGRAVERMCVPGTYFTQEVVKCMQRQYVPSCGGSLPDTKPKAEKPAAEITNYPDGPNCEQLDIGNYPAGNCEHHYYTCNFGSTIRRDCPKHLYYDAEFDRCELRKYMPNCGGRRPPPKTTPRPLVEEQLMDCSGKKDGGYPDPHLSGCSKKYIMCANGLAFRFECPGDLYFDSDSLDCLSAMEISACHP